jgi:hypothetical protein
VKTKLYIAVNDDSWVGGVVKCDDIEVLGENTLIINGAVIVFDNNIKLQEEC